MRLVGRAGVTILDASFASHLSHKLQSRQAALTVGAKAPDFDVVGINRAIAVTGAVVLHLDQRLQPQHTARAGAHDLDKPSARGRASGQQFCHDPVRNIA